MEELCENIERYRELGIQNIPVSYTHLDVYKRQAEPRRYCILTENMMEKGGVWVRQKTETLSERVAVKIRQYIIENEMKAGDRCV